MLACRSEIMPSAWSGSSSLIAQSLKTLWTTKRPQAKKNISNNSKYMF